MAEKSSLFIENDQPFEMLAWTLPDGTWHDPLGVVTSWQYWKREAMRHQLDRWWHSGSAGLIADCQRRLDEAQREFTAFIAERRAASPTVNERSG